MSALVRMVLLFAAVVGAARGQSDELLPPEEAFAFSAEAASPHTVTVTWNIADDYYMYRDKFSATVVDGEVAITELVLPEGKVKHDEFFGEQVIYTGSVVLQAKLDRSLNPAPVPVTLEIIGQGCNEPVGVCYPPLQQTVSLQLAAAPESAPSPMPSGSNVGDDPAVDSLASLRALLGVEQQAQEFLHPDEAFKFDLVASAPDALSAHFVIAPGYYLYRDKVGFESQTQGVSVAAYELPPGVEKEDEYFGRMITYFDGFDVDLPLLRGPDGPDKASFKVTYQGCAEKGICYPPVDKRVVLDLLPVDTAVAAVPAAGKTGLAVSPPQGFWGYVAGAFGVGLLLTFTPCVLPLIPIMSSFIVGQGGTASRARGGLLSLIYVLGTAVTYTAAGVLAGASGDQLQAYFQNIWFVGLVAIVLTVLALSMFGLYEIQMPSAIQSRLQQRTAGLGGGKFAMVFLLGAISALIVGACVSPLLIGALGVAIVKGDPVLGGAIMFSMALGMGVFLVLLGAGMGVLVPKAGAWMDYVKYAFGVVLIGTAVYLLGTVPWIPVLYLWAVLFIVTAIYCGALQSLPQGASGWRYLWKGIGVVLLVWGVLALVGGMSGSRDILRPVDVSTWRGGQERMQARLVEFARVGNLEQLDRQLELARLDAKPLILDYYADWCVDCVRMEKATFSDPEVAQALAGFSLVQVDVTEATDPSAKAVKARYGVYGPPAMLFFDPSGRERTELRRYGFMPPDEFLSHLAQL